MAQRAKQVGSRHSQERPRAVGAVAEEGEEPEAATPTCTVGFCPLCLAVTAVQPLAPDVVGHLLNAGRELLLAAGSIVSARADAVSDDAVKPSGLERIDIG